MFTSIGAAIFGIVSAVSAVAGATTSGIQAGQKGKARREALKLAKIQRQDEMKTANTQLENRRIGQSIQRDQNRQDQRFLQRGENMRKTERREAQGDSNTASMQAGSQLLGGKVNERMKTGLNKLGRFGS